MKNLHKDNILKRLKSAHGHLNHVINMIEKDDYCIDILQQSLAVQKALKKTDEIILDSHLQTCVLGEMQHQPKEKTVKEIIEVFRKR